MGGAGSLACPNGFLDEARQLASVLPEVEIGDDLGLRTCARWGAPGSDLLITSAFARQVSAAILLAAIIHRFFHG